MPSTGFDFRTLLIGLAVLLPHATADAADPTPPPPGAPAAPVAPAAAPAAEMGEPKITVPGAEGDYLRLIHGRIHFRFANRFINDIAAKQPASDPMNRPGLRTEILFGLRWDGSLSDAVVTEKSGVEAFDQAALAAVRTDTAGTASARYPPPPADLFGDDGVAHFQWVFARNRNLCGEGSVRRVEAPLAQALPRLFVQGRIKEALLRAARDARAGSGDAIAIFAQAWLERPQADPATDARAAGALLRYGDKRMRAKSLARIKPALARKETAAIASAALGAFATSGAAELDPAGFCELVGGAKALRRRRAGRARTGDGPAA
jgi:hypothetical protein